VGIGWGLLRVVGGCRFRSTARHDVDASRCSDFHPRLAAWMRLRQLGQGGLNGIDRIGLVGDDNDGVRIESLISFVCSHSVEHFGDNF